MCPCVFTNRIFKVDNIAAIRLGLRFILNIIRFLYQIKLEFFYRLTQLTNKSLIISYSLILCIFFVELQLTQPKLRILPCRRARTYWCRTRRWDKPARADKRCSPRLPRTYPIRPSTIKTARLTNVSIPIFNHSQTFI